MRRRDSLSRETKQKLQAVLDALEDAPAEKLDYVVAATQAMTAGISIGRDIAKKELADKPA